MVKDPRSNMQVPAVSSAPGIINYESDWRLKCGSVLERCCEARRRNFYTDVDFLVGEGDSIKTFSAHKNILAFSSPVFEAMFYGDLAEKKKPIPITDIDPEAFDALLRFVYGEKICFKTVAFAANTYIAADKYLVTDLQKSAEDHVTKATMDDPQFWQVIHEDRFFHIPVVQKKCLEYITTKAATLLKSYLLANVSVEVIEAILLMDRIMITEYELLSALILWGIGNVQSVTKLKSKLEPLLCHIRFSNLTKEEFCNFDDCHPGLVNIDDSWAIMKHLCNKALYKLPHWCCTSTKQRNV